MRQREKRSKCTVEVAHSILVDINNQPSLCKTKPNQTGRIWAYGHLLFTLSQSTYLLSTDDFFSKDGGGGGTEGAGPNRHPPGLIGRDITLSWAEAVTVTKCRCYRRRKAQCHSAPRVVFRTTVWKRGRRETGNRSGRDNERFPDRAYAKRVIEAITLKILKRPFAQ